MFYLVRMTSVCVFEIFARLGKRLLAELTLSAATIVEIFFAFVSRAFVIHLQTKL
jgi:hypothetical protein